MNWTMRLAIRYSIFFLLFLGTIQLQGAKRKPIPDPMAWGYVHDYANVLSDAEEEGLFKKLKAYEDSTSTQIAVIIEKSLNNRDVFDRAMDFTRPEINPKWNGGVGQKGMRNGIVMYFAMDERKIFILPADRTQGNLPDGLVGSIIRNNIAPYFKQGDYYAGISNGIDKIIAALAGEFTNDGKPGGSSILPIILFTLFIILIFYLARKGGGGGGYHRRGTYWFPTGNLGRGGRGGWSGGGGGGFGGFGGGGGFNGGGAGGGW